jgi:hypothetical protein
MARKKDEGPKKDKEGGCDYKDERAVVPHSGDGGVCGWVDYLHYDINGLHDFCLFVWLGEQLTKCCWLPPAVPLCQLHKHFSTKGRRRGKDGVFGESRGVAGVAGVAGDSRCVASRLRWRESICYLAPHLRFVHQNGRNMAEINDYANSNRVVSLKSYGFWFSLNKKPP